MKVGIFGTGAYGMALSSILSDNNCEITMWTKFEEEKQQLELTRKNEKLIPNFLIDEKIKLTTDIKECIDDKELLIIAIPAAFIDSLCREMKPYIKNNNILIATKGIEQKTGLFIHDIVQKHLNTKNIAVLSGPSFAIDIVSKMPVGLSLATKSKCVRNKTLKAFQNNYVKLRCTKDIIGTEICGSIKNVIALSAGIIDGLGATDSTKAMLLTEAIHDMKEIIDAFGGNKNTVLSFAGFGDLLLTCTSTKSRNFTFGRMIGMKTTKEELDKYKNETTIEGLYTLESIYLLLRNKKISIPIITLIYDIIINNKEPKKLLTFLVEKD